MITCQVFRCYCQGGIFLIKSKGCCMGSLSQIVQIMEQIVQFSSSVQKLKGGCLMRKAASWRETVITNLH